MGALIWTKASNSINSSFDKLSTFGLQVPSHNRPSDDVKETSASKGKKRSGLYRWRQVETWVNKIVQNALGR